MEEDQRRKALLITGTQSLIVLAMIALQPTGLSFALLHMVAFQLGFILSPGRAVAWIAAQVGVALWLVSGGRTPLQLMSSAATLLAFQCLTLGLARFSGGEFRARRDLVKAHGELLLSRELLARASRLAERQRISRELHDLLGHDLTAMNLDLEVAGHLTQGKAQEHVRRAQEINRKLLGDVREVVSTLRGDEIIDLRQTMERFCTTITRPTIHLAFPSDLDMDDPLRAQTMLRCVQEIITNSIRHADAANLWLEFTRDGDHVALKAHDDGCGTSLVRAGSGLTGMRDRLRELGGSVHFTSQSMHGFQVDIHLPLLEPAP